MRTLDFCAVDERSLKPCDRARFRCKHGQNRWITKLLIFLLLLVPSTNAISSSSNGTSLADGSRLAVCTYLAVPDFNAAAASAVDPITAISAASSALVARMEQVRTLLGMLNYFGSDLHEQSQFNNAQEQQSTSVRYVFVSVSAINFIESTATSSMANSSTTTNASTSDISEAVSVVTACERAAAAVQQALRELRSMGAELLFVFLGDSWFSWQLNALYHMSSIFQLKPHYEAALFLSPTSLVLSNPFPAHILERAAATVSCSDTSAGDSNADDNASANVDITTAGTAATGTTDVDSGGSRHEIYCSHSTLYPHIKTTATEEVAAMDDSTAPAATAATVTALEEHDGDVHSQCDLSAMLLTSAVAARNLRLVLQVAQQLLSAKQSGDDFFDNDALLADVFHRAASTVAWPIELQPGVATDGESMAAVIRPLGGYQRGVVPKANDCRAGHSSCSSRPHSEADALFVSSASAADDHTDNMLRVLTMPLWTQPVMQQQQVDSLLSPVLHSVCAVQYLLASSYASSPWSLARYVLNAHIDSCRLLNAHRNSGLFPSSTALHQQQQQQLNTGASSVSSSMQFDRIGRNSGLDGVYLNYSAATFEVPGSSSDSVPPAPRCHLLWMPADRKDIDVADAAIAGADTSTMVDEYAFSGIISCRSLLPISSRILVVTYLNSIAVGHEFLRIDNSSSNTSSIDDSKSENSGSDDSGGIDISGDGSSIDDSSFTKFDVVFPLRFHMLTLQGVSCGRVAAFVYASSAAGAAAADWELQPPGALHPQAAQRLLQHSYSDISLLASFSSTICVEPRALQAVEAVRDIPVLWDGKRAINITMTVITTADTDDEQSNSHSSHSSSGDVSQEDGSVSVRLDRENDASDDPMQRTYNYTITRQMATQSFFNASTRLVFVSGNHHSGTTILRKLLGNDRSRARIVLREAWPQPYLVHDYYHHQQPPMQLAQLFKLPVTQHGEARYVFDAILRHSAQWRVIYLVRDLRDVLFSLQQRHYHLPPAFVYSSATSCWIRAAQLGLMLKPLKHVRLVRYEDLFDAPHYRTLRQLFNFAGLRFDEELVEHNAQFVSPIATRIIDGVLQPLYPNFSMVGELNSSMIVSYRYKQVHEDFTQRSGQWKTSPYASDISEFLKTQYPSALDYLGMFGYLD